MIINIKGNSENEKLIKGINFGIEYGWVTLHGAIKIVVDAKQISTNDANVFSWFFRTI